MGLKARVFAFAGLVALFALIATPLVRRESPRDTAIDPWTHVLGRIARGGPSNSEGPYASSYTRAYRTRAGADTTLLLVDAPRREMALAEPLFKAGFIREAAFHLRNVRAFHADAPEAAKAAELLDACGKRAPVRRIAPL